MTKTVHKTLPGLAGAEGLVGRIESNFGLVLIVDQIEFSKTRWPCPWNSDHNCTQISARGWVGRGW